MGTLLRFVGCLGLLALALFLCVTIIAIGQTFADNLQKRKIEKQIYKEIMKELKK